MTISASVTVIGREAFWNCKELRKLSFAPGSKLEKIGSESFCNTGMERITIPKSVKEIQDSAFRNCESLKYVIFEAGSVLEKIGT